MKTKRTEELDKKWDKMVKEVSYKNKSEVMTKNQFVRAILMSARNAFLEGANQLRP